METFKSGADKDPQELLRENIIRENPAFLEALAEARSFSQVADIVRENVHVIKSEDGDADYVVGHVYENATGETDVYFFEEQELLDLIKTIEANPNWAEQDIVQVVEHTAIADALIRIASEK